MHLFSPYKFDCLLDVQSKDDAAGKTSYLGGSVNHFTATASIFAFFNALSDALY
jgi:hypothetical protein